MKEFTIKVSDVVAERYMRLSLVTGRSLEEEVTAGAVYDVMRCDDFDYYLARMREFYDSKCNGGTYVPPKR